MSSLKERLGRLNRTPSAAAAQGNANASAPEAAKPRSVTLGASWERLDAVLEENEYGSLIIRRRRYPLHYNHGLYRLGELCGEAGALGRLASPARKRGAGQRKGAADGAAQMPQIEHGRLLFLDTETTGLGLGAGNVAFMVGIGFFEPSGFVVEQLFIRNPAEEAAMLCHLHGRLRDRDILVTYNGKSFDWPILKNRCVLNRQKPDSDPLHLDFLYPSRSLWRGTLPSVRLGAVERERLGLSRIDDVPGSLAPALYFQYLSEGDPTLVAGVFEHNEKDILTLVCLAVHFTRLLNGEASRERMEAEELFRLALWLDKSGLPGMADEAFRELLDGRPEDASEFWLSVADFYKRQGRYEPAVALWRKAIDRRRRSRLASLAPYIELAMYYEHREKDWAEALYYAEQALEKAVDRHSLDRRKNGGQEADTAALRKRVERLAAKCESVKHEGTARERGKKARAAKAGLSRLHSTAVHPDGSETELWQPHLMLGGE